MSNYVETFLLGSLTPFARLRGLRLASFESQQTIRCSRSFTAG